MFESVLVPIDFSPGSLSAASSIQHIPGVREIVLLHVLYNRYPLKDPSLVHPRVKEARTVLEKIKSSLAMPEVTITTVIEEITGGEIAPVINQVAGRMGISVVVMGRRGTGIIENLLLGSVASDMLRYGTIDLLLIPPPSTNAAKFLEPHTHVSSLTDHVMVCTDFSEPEIGSICLEELPSIRRVSLFNTVTTGDSKDEIRSAVTEAESKLGKIRDAFSHRGIPIRVQVSVGSAPEEILGYSQRENVSLILLKSTGKKSTLNILIGSTSAPVARNASKPVLVLKRSRVVIR